MQALGLLSLSRTNAVVPQSRCGNEQYFQQIATVTKPVNFLKRGNFTSCKSGTLTSYVHVPG